MAFIPVPNVAKVTLQWVLAGQTVEITISLLRSAGWTTPTLAQAAVDVRDWYIAQVRPNQASTMTLVNVNATDQSSASSPSYDLPVVASNVGTNASTPLPNSVAAVTKFLTASRGRSFRGRAYNVGLVQNMQATSTLLTTASAAALTAMWAALSGFLTLSASSHVVASRFAGGVPRGSGIATPITGYATDQSFDSQRRRLAGRGI